MGSIVLHPHGSNNKGVPKNNIRKGKREMAEKKSGAKKSTKKKKEELMTQPLRKLTREEKMAYLTGGKSKKR